MSTRRGVEIGDLLEFRFPSRPALSPDGTAMVYVVQKADAEKNRYRSEIWHAGLDFEVSRPLTRSGRDSSPLWLDDGRVLFQSARDVADSASPEEKRASAWYVISPDGGEAEHSFTVSRPVSWIRQLGPTRFLLLTRWDPTWGEERTEHETRVHVFDQAPIWSNGVGYLHGGGVRLSLFDTERDELLDLTPEGILVSTATLSPDRGRVALVTTENAPLHRPESRLHLLELGDFDTGAGRAAGSPPLIDLGGHTGLPVGYYSMPGFVGEAALVFGFADPAEHGLNTSPQLYRIDLDQADDGSPRGSVARRLTEDATLRMGVNSVGSDSRLGTPDGGLVRGDAAGLVFVGTRGTDSNLYRMTPSGTLEQLTAAAGSVDALDLRGGRIAFTAMRDLRLPEVYILEEGAGGALVERRVTGLNDGWHERVDLASPVHIAVSSNDDELDAWVMLPPGHDATTATERSIPAILNIHGGPRTVYGTVYSHEMQVWAARGFAVIFANPHGSDGRGDGFADIRGRYGTLDYEDLMNVVDRALERHPAIDPERLCVTGGSYGGFMTNWMIGHTQRFAVAASQRSISNWISFWGTSDIGHYFGNDQTAADPWSDPDALWCQSPLAYANAARTPTLFIHSDADYRCWIPDAIQMHTALCYHGVESRLVWIEDENHELSRSGKPHPRLRRLQEITDWFTSHLAE
ncbi:MAG: prolyl oligopeptidase family serine peptidase [Spirochaetota bacterium]